MSLQGLRTPLARQLCVWAVSMMQGLISRIRETHEVLKRLEIVDQTIIQKIASTEFEGDVTTAIDIDLNDLTDGGDKDESSLVFIESIEFM